MQIFVRTEHLARSEGEKFGFCPTLLNVMTHWDLICLAMVYIVDAVTTCNPFMEEIMINLDGSFS